MGIIDTLTSLVAPDILGSLFKRALPPREKRVRSEGSPAYTWTPGVIAATASSSIFVDTQFPDSRKYAPLDWLEIVNNDVVDLTLTINGDESWPIPAGVIRTRSGGIGLHHITITNNDAAAASTAGKIVITMQKEAMTADKQIQGQYK